MADTLTPFVRYALLIIAGMAVRGGWMPEAIATQMATDPALIEAVTGLLIGTGTTVWYLLSRSRKALTGAA